MLAEYSLFHAVFDDAGAPVRAGGCGVDLEDMTGLTQGCVGIIKTVEPFGTVLPDRTQRTRQITNRATQSICSQWLFAGLTVAGWVFSPETLPMASDVLWHHLTQSICSCPRAGRFLLRQRTRRPCSAFSPEPLLAAVYELWHLSMVPTHAGLLLKPGQVLERTRRAKGIVMASDGPEELGSRLLYQHS